MFDSSLTTCMDPDNGLSIMRPFLFLFLVLAMGIFIGDLGLALKKLESTPKKLLIFYCLPNTTKTNNCGLGEPVRLSGEHVLQMSEFGISSNKVRITGKGY